MTIIMFHEPRTHIVSRIYVNIARCALKANGETMIGLYACS